MPFPIRFHIGVFQQLEIRRGDEAVQPRAVILPVRADDGAHRVQSEWDSERRVREQDFDKPWYNLRGIVCALVELNVLGEIALLKVEAYDIRCVVHAVGKGVAAFVFPSPEIVVRACLEEAIPEVIAESLSHNDIVVRDSVDAGAVSAPFRAKIDR